MSLRDRFIRRIASPPVRVQTRTWPMRFGNETRSRMVRRLAGPGYEVRKASIWILAPLGEMRLVEASQDLGRRGGGHRAGPRECRIWRGARRGLALVLGECGRV